MIFKIKFNVLNNNKILYYNDYIIEATNSNDAQLQFEKLFKYNKHNNNQLEILSIQRLTDGSDYKKSQDTFNEIIINKQKENIYVEINLIYEKLKEIQHIIENEINIEINHKNNSELVTNLDIKIEQELIKFLQDIDNIQCLSEETNIPVSNSSYWVIDPIDGTTNFIHGYPSYCISIAKVENNETIFGIVYNIATDECFYSIKGQGSFIVQKSTGYTKNILVSKTDNIQNSLIGFGCPYNKDRTEELFKITTNILKLCRDLKRNGPASLDLCYVACGRLDAYFELDLKEWDYKAGKLILEEAGGKITNFNNKYIKNGKNDILATNNCIHNEFLKFL